MSARATTSRKLIDKFIAEVDMSRQGVELMRRPERQPNDTLIDGHFFQFDARSVCSAAAPSRLPRLRRHGRWPKASSLRRGHIIC